jgi:hypothetical protein
MFNPLRGCRSSFFCLPPVPQATLGVIKIELLAELVKNLKTGYNIKVLSTANIYKI